jgi:hypothetical protein
MVTHKKLSPYVNSIELSDFQFQETAHFFFPVVRAAFFSISVSFVLTQSFKVDRGKLKALAAFSRPMSFFIALTVCLIASLSHCSRRDICIKNKLKLCGVPNIAY